MPIILMENGTYFSIVIYYLPVLVEPKAFLKMHRLNFTRPVDTDFGIVVHIVVNHNVMNCFVKAEIPHFKPLGSIDHKFKVLLRSSERSEGRAGA